MLERARDWSAVCRPVPTTSTRSAPRCSAGLIGAIWRTEPSPKYSRCTLTAGKMNGSALEASRYSIFLDGLAVDLERMERINRTVRLIPPEKLSEAKVELRPVKVLFISPSQPIERIAARFVHELPPMVRFVLRPTGAMNRSGSNLVSYLLFEESFCRTLIDLGYQDTVSREPDVRAFFEDAA